MLLEQVMLVYCPNRDQHVQTAESQVDQEQQKVSVVFQSDAIVNERTVMVHQEGALVAYFTVVCAHRLDFIT